jgi:hypothetical protein
MSGRRGVIVDNGIVVNTVVWGDESQEQFNAKGHDRVEETTGWLHPPGIGWTWTKEFGYRPPQPYPSWIWDEEAFNWVCLIPMPENSECENGWMEWDEGEQEWVCNQQIEE